MTTATQTYSIRQAMDDSNPSLRAEALRDIKLGKQQKKIKATITALTAIAAPDITALVGASLSIVINQGPDDIVKSGVLPPIGKLVSLTCTTSDTANSVGSYAVTDAGGTALTPTAGANLGLAKISDDGKTITFPTTITGFTIEYFAMPLTVAGPNNSWVSNDVNAELGQPGGGIGDE